MAPSSPEPIHGDSRGDEQPESSSGPDGSGGAKPNRKEDADGDLYADIDITDDADAGRRHCDSDDRRKSDKDRDRHSDRSHKHDKDRKRSKDREGERISRHRDGDRHSSHSRSHRDRDRDSDRRRDRDKDSERRRDRGSDSERRKDRNYDDEQRRNREPDGDGRRERASEPSRRRERDYDEDRRRNRGSEPERRRAGQSRELDYEPERRREREYRSERRSERDYEPERRREHDYGSNRRGERERERERELDAERERGRRDERGAPRGGDLVLGGYKPRMRASGMVVPQTTDPFAAVRAKNVAQGMAVSSFAEAGKVRLEQQAKARQMVLQQQATSAAAAASKTQREVYIGNLQQGKVTEQSLRDLFDQALSSVFPNLVVPGVPPCISVAMHSEGRYAFVELATPEMATAALSLSGQLDFLGSQMTVGRPSGYIDPSKAQAAAAAAAKALQEFESGEGLPIIEKGEAPPTIKTQSPCLCINHMATAQELTDEEEYQGMVEDLTEECKRHGIIVDIRVPRPDAGIAAEAVLGKGCYGKVYVLMDDAEGAVRLKEAVDGRLYDGRTLSASFVQQNHFYQLPIALPR